MTGTHTTTLQRLIHLASQKFNVPETQLGPDVDFFQTLKINSFQALALLSDVEKHFSIEIPDYELQGVTTFQALADLIDTRRGYES